MFWLTKIIAVLAGASLVNICKGRINMTSYSLMPTLYVFEDYNECLYNNNSISDHKVYCMTYAEIIPNNSSLLWHYIEELSHSYQFHYRHDHLFRGVCLNSSRNDKNWKYTTFKNEITDIFNRIFNNSKDGLINMQYQYDLNNLLNKDFHSKYNLTLQTLILYCDSLDFSQEKGFGFKITIFICVIIVLLNILSSLYDGYLKSQQTRKNNNKYYKRNHATQVCRFLTSFSIYRNFCCLSGSNNSDIGKDLSFLDGFRTILSFLIVYEHSYYFQFVHLKNPEFFENLYHEYFMKFMLHGMVLVELFFILSGLMLYIKLENARYVKENTSFGDCFRIYGKLLFARYMRYLPSLGFLILINVNITQYLQKGPYWRFMMEPTCYLCHKYWWKNVLMFNNFDISNSCLSHTWYVAADFQLYAFYLLILIFLAKYPKYKMWTFLIIAILSAIVPTVINYLLKLDSIAFMKLESFRYFYLIDIETGSQLYLPSYTNLHGFLVGIVCAELYIKYLRQNPKVKKSFGKLLKYSPYIGWPSIMGIFFVGTLLLDQQPSIWTALYGLLQRHVTITVIAITTILLMMSKPGIISKILSSLPFRLLARLSYQVYLWHFIIILMIANHFNQPVNITYYLMLLVLLVAYINTNFIALIIALAIEYPIANILNILNLK